MSIVLNYDRAAEFVALEEILDEDCYRVIAAMRELIEHGDEPTQRAVAKVLGVPPMWVCRRLKTITGIAAKRKNLVM